MKVVAAVGELEQDYGTQAKFVIVNAEETAQRGDEIEEFGFTELKHGLVIFDSTGVARFKLPGHRFGRPEIESGLLEVLAD